MVVPEYVLLSVMERNFKCFSDFIPLTLPVEKPFATFTRQNRNGFSKLGLLTYHHLLGSTFTILEGSLNL